MATKQQTTMTGKTTDNNDWHDNKKHLNEQDFCPVEDSNCCRLVMRHFQAWYSGMETAPGTPCCPVVKSRGRIRSLLVTLL